jgi:hypothetical protein
MVSRSAQLLTNDIRQPVVHVTLHGNVVHPVQVIPEELRLTPREEGAGPETLLLTAPQDVELLEVVASPRELLVSPQAPDTSADGGRSWRLAVALAGKPPSAGLRGQITLRTSSAEVPSVVVPITVEACPAVRAQPRTLFFGFLRVGKIATRTLTVRGPADPGFAVRDVAVDAIGCRAQKPVQGKAGEWVVHVTARGERPGIITGKVILSTTVRGEERVEVPIYGHVATWR